VKVIIVFELYGFLVGLGLQELHGDISVVVILTAGKFME
jgi:hypothetical protein